MARHVLKSWIGLFGPISRGEKTYEFRVMDRDYRVGDVLELNEYDPTLDRFTGRICTVRVTYIESHTNDAPFVPHVLLGSNVALLSIKRIV